MLMKNLKKYKDRFDTIALDRIERIREYLDSKPFNKKDYIIFHKKMKYIFSIKWKYIKIVLDIIPEPTPRARLGSKGVFYVKNSKSNSEFTKKMLKDDLELYQYVTTPCSYVIDVYFPIPSSFTKVEVILAELGLIPKISIPDWDNLGKTYSDMIQKWIISNDSLIIDGRVRKHYSLKPRVEILIKYADKNFTKRDERTIERSISYKDGIDIRENIKAEEN